MTSTRVVLSGVLIALAWTATGCLAPELDTPPLPDPNEESSSSGAACKEGVYSANVDLGGAKPAKPYTGECTIAGSVTFAPTVTADKLLPMLKVQTITGSLAVPDLSGATDHFGALQTIGGTLTIGGAKLDRISGFPKLAKVTSIFISGGSAVTTITGFAVLTSVPDGLSIDNLKNVTTIDAFPVLSAQHVSVKGCPNLSSFRAFGSMTTSTKVMLHSLPALGTLDAFGKSATS